LGDDLVLCNVSVANFPLEDVIPAAAAAGFRSMSVLGRCYRRASVRSGLSGTDLRHLLDDHGIAVTDVEAVGDWLGPVPYPEDSYFHPAYDLDGYLELAGVLGARTVVATHFGPPVPVDVAAEAFATMCDRAGERGLRVALEFVAFATIADVVGAWGVVRAADRINGGLLLDVWHHRRSPASDADLDAVPADRIFSVQISDAAAQPVGTLVDDVANRRLPGDGDFDVAALLRHLDGRGVRCPVGVEVLNRDIVAGGPLAAARRLYAALAAVTAASHPTKDHVA